MLHKKVFLFLALLCVFASAAYAGAGSSIEILSVRHWVAPDHTRLVIDTSNEADFRVEKGELRITVILKNAILPASLAGMKVYNNKGLNAIFLSSHPHSTVLIEIGLSESLPINIFKLKRFRDKPDRIVVDILLPEPGKDAKERPGGTASSKSRERVVVIDPGHGGDDPGAVGKNGTYEKDVVLDISRKLRDILNKKEGYRVFLTRTGDYYVPFKKRLMIARNYSADLFLSIHADASRNRAARGSSVYCIADGAASSEAARILANNENLADVIGGVSAGEQSDASDPIILNMFQTHVKNQSRSFGRMLLNELKPVSGSKFSDVQEAPFYVLKLPEITSVLLETAFISNPQEEKLLKKEAFQKEVARAAADSIVKFFPPLPDQKGKSGNSLSAKTSYVVKRGDTLYSIATSHGTTPDVIKEFNELKQPDLLYIGSRLIIPGKEK